MKYLNVLFLFCVSSLCAVHESANRPIFAAAVFTLGQPRVQVIRFDGTKMATLKNVRDAMAHHLGVQRNVVIPGFIGLNLSLDMPINNDMGTDSSNPIICVVGVPQDIF